MQSDVPTIQALRPTKDPGCNCSDWQSSHCEETSMIFVRFCEPASCDIEKYSFARHEDCQQNVPTRYYDEFYEFYDIRYPTPTKIPTPAWSPSAVPGDWISDNIPGVGECNDNQVQRCRYYYLDGKLEYQQYAGREFTHLECECVDIPEGESPTPSLGFVGDLFEELEDKRPEFTPHPTRTPWPTLSPDLERKCVSNPTDAHDYKGCGTGGCLPTEAQVCQKWVWNDTGEECDYKCQCYTTVSCGAETTDQNYPGFGVAPTPRPNPKDTQPKVSVNRCVKEVGSDGEYTGEYICGKTKSAPLAYDFHMYGSTGRKDHPMQYAECFTDQDCDNYVDIYENYPELEGALCGDGICNGWETYLNCESDCRRGDNTCPNGTCEFWETVATCPEDCPGYCGDGLCWPGESLGNCPEDCFLGNDQCNLTEMYQNQRPYSGEASGLPEDKWMAAGSGTTDIVGLSHKDYYRCHGSTAKTCIQEGGIMHDNNCCCLPKENPDFIREVVEGEVCGNGQCRGYEDADNCPEDCLDSENPCLALNESPYYSGCHCQPIDGLEWDTCYGMNPLNPNYTSDRGADFEACGKNARCCCDRVMNGCEVTNYNNEGVEAVCVTAEECMALDQEDHYWQIGLSGSDSGASYKTNNLSCGPGKVCCWQLIKMSGTARGGPYPEDVYNCGNGKCESDTTNEDCKTCPEDCPCPEGMICMNARYDKEFGDEIGVVEQIYTGWVGEELGYSRGASGKCVTPEQYDEYRNRYLTSISNSFSSGQSVNQPENQSRQATFQEGDANFDGVVDDRDFSQWWKSFGKDNRGDFNLDGMTNDLDYVVWWQNFMKHSPF